mmetsp:Transcript_18884/g.29540  ORF Transcript_18884/g.29540 Transcript_18884/m.29540 type:complete len:173 (+) Transcript_18884:399-917(+)
MKSELNPEGAGAIIGGWQEHAANEKAQPGRDFKKLNRMAILRGQGLNPQQISEFRRSHDARLRAGHERGLAALNLPSAIDPAFVYGIKSGNRASMDALMHNEYANQWEANQNQKQNQYKMEKKIIPVMHTRASLGQRFVEPVPDEKRLFKIKKFEKIPGRLASLYGPLTART